MCLFQLLENKPSATFWSSLGRALEKYTKDSVRGVFFFTVISLDYSAHDIGSSFMQQTLSTGYPRLLRLFHEFFAKIAVHTDTVYVHSHQRLVCSCRDLKPLQLKFRSPETVLILRAVSSFESLYLSRSATKLNEAVSQAFTGGARTPAGATEGINIARAIANEFDAARFDPLLVVNVTKNAVSTLELMLSRVDALVSRMLFSKATLISQFLGCDRQSFCKPCWSHSNATANIERLFGHLPLSMLAKTTEARGRAF